MAESPATTGHAPLTAAPTRSWRLHLALVAATLAYCPLLFTNLDHYGRRDWDQFTVRYEAPRLALVRDRQLPLWNPYVNGGTVLLAHPHSPAASPWYALVLAVGAPLGLRVQVVLFMALGAMGMAALLRRWNVPAAGCFAGGVVFMMSSHFALHMAEGHLEWCVLGLMPWLGLCLVRLDRGLRFLVGGALLLASVLTFGSVYIVAVYVPFLSVWMLLESVRTRRPRYVLGWCGVLGLAALVSAVKLLPQWEFTGGHPRATPPEGFSPRGLGYVLLDPRQAFLYRATRDVFIPDEYAFSRTVPPDVALPVNLELADAGLVQVFHEYGCYITWLGLGLAAVGLVAAWRTHWPLFVAGGLALVTALGNGLPVDLWSALQRLPLYSSMHVPSRFVAAVLFALAVAAGFGLGWLCRLAERRRAAWLVLLPRYVVPAAIYAELAVLGWTLFGDIFVCKPLRPAYAAASGRAANGAAANGAAGREFAVRAAVSATYFPTMTSYLYAHLLENSGVLHGYENIAVPQGDVKTVRDPDYRGEIYLLEGEGALSLRRWTMSRVTANVQVVRPDRVVLNQNHSPGWQARIEGTVPRTIAAEWTRSGLVSAAVRPGDQTVELFYRPGSFVYGAWISGVSLAGCVISLVATACVRRSRASAGSPA